MLPLCAHSSTQFRLCSCCMIRDSCRATTVAVACELLTSKVTGHWLTQVHAVQCRAQGTPSCCNHTGGPEPLPGPARCDVHPRLHQWLVPWRPLRVRACQRRCRLCGLWLHELAPGGSQPPGKRSSFVLEIITAVHETAALCCHTAGMPSLFLVSLVTDQHPSWLVPGHAIWSCVCPRLT